MARTIRFPHTALPLTLSLLAGVATVSAWADTPAATVTELSGVSVSDPGSLTAATNTVALGALTSPAAFNFNDLSFGQTGSFTDTFTFTLDPAVFTSTVVGFELTSFSQVGGIVSSFKLYDDTQNPSLAIATATSGTSGWYQQLNGTTVAANDMYSLVVSGNIVSTATAQYSGTFQTLPAVPEPSNVLMLLAVLCPMGFAFARRRPAGR